MSNDCSFIRVEAPARLHLGFLDPSATLGRRFGSIGLAIDALATAVSVAPGAALNIIGAADERIEQLLDVLIRHYALPARFDLHVERATPPHVGLGSGTQLALAIGTALTKAHGHEVNAGELGQLLGRGRRSGLGLGLFEHGGLVVDAGHGPATRTPPLISRLEFPDEWRVLLIFDDARRGLSGDTEIAAFSALPGLPAAVAAHLCHLTLLGVLPAIVERDFTLFSRAIAEIQAVIGEHFAVIQAGPYTSQRVSDVIQFLRRQRGIEGVGQSSWGPTAFAFVNGPAAADAAIDALRAAFAAEPNLRFMHCGAQNQGARLLPRLPTVPRRRAIG